MPKYLIWDQNCGWDVLGCGCRCVIYKINLRWYAKWLSKAAHRANSSGRSYREAHTHQCLARSTQKRHSLYIFLKNVNIWCTWTIFLRYMSVHHVHGSVLLKTRSIQFFGTGGLNGVIQSLCGCKEQQAFLTPESFISPNFNLITIEIKTCGSALLTLKNLNNEQKNRSQRNVLNTTILGNL